MLDAALEALAQGNNASALARLREFDHHLASRPDVGPDASTILRARGRLLVVAEALSQHAAYFDTDATP